MHKMFTINLFKLLKNMFAVRNPIYKVEKREQLKFEKIL
jgi:hypothetical protein